MIYTSGEKFEAFKRAARARNRRFEKKSLSEQRLAIARDVIEQIEAGDLTAASAYFASSDLSRFEDRIFRRESLGEVDASVVLPQVADCRVCGIGSLFKCAVENANSLPIKDLLHGDTRENEVRYLRTWFSKEQLNLVEDFYERHTRWQDYHSSYTRVGARSGKPVGDSPIMAMEHDGTRLKMIMENIIANNGKFNPWRGPHKSKKF